MVKEFPQFSTNKHLAILNKFTNYRTDTSRGRSRGPKFLGRVTSNRPGLGESSHSSKVLAWPIMLIKKRTILLVFP